MEKFLDYFLEHRPLWAAFCLLTGLLTFAVFPGFSQFAEASEIDCLTKIASAEQTGRMYDLIQDGERIFVKAEKGLFRVELTGEQASTSAVRGTEGATIFSIMRSGASLYIGTNKGLFVLAESKEEAEPFARETQTGKIYSLSNIGGRLFVSSQKALYVVEGNSLKALIEKETYYAGLIGGRTIAVTAEGVAYQSIGNQWLLIAHGIPKTYTAIAHPVDFDSIVLGTEFGIYFVKFEHGAANVTHLDYVTPSLGLVMKLVPYNDEIIVGARTGLFRIKAPTPDRIQITHPQSVRYGSKIDTPEVFDTHLIYDILIEPNALLLASDAGLFRQQKGHIRYVHSGEQTGPVFGFFRYQDRILLPSRSGLFEYLVNNIDSGKIQRADKKSIIADRNAEGVRVNANLGVCRGIGQSLPIAWTLEGQGDFRVDGRGRHIGDEKSNSVYDITFDKIDAENVGSYELKAKILDVAGNVSVLANLPLSVSPDWQKIITKIAGVSGIFVVVLHFVFYATLVALSPIYNWAFELLFDVKFGRGRLYFNEILGRSKLLQLYVFSRVFLCQKRFYQNGLGHGFFPVPLKTSSGTTLKSDEILEFFIDKRRIALVGKAGRGKTATLQKMVTSYFENGTIWQAWNRCKFIMVPIRLRDFRRVEVRDREWLVRIIQLTFAEYGTPVADAAVIDRLLTSGLFAPCLDGLNEVGREQDLQVIVKECSQLPVFYTARSTGFDKIFRLSLPDNLSPYTKGILTALRGEEVASRIMEGLDHQLCEEIRSGFEIWLLARVCDEGQHSPRSRLDLYNQVIDQAANFGFSNELDRILSHCAWKLWIKDERIIGDVAQIEAGEILVLLDSNILFQRGSSFVEFSHDQMRGFFAARWLTVHLHDVRMIIEAINADEVWKSAPSVQNEMFSFFADMLMRYWDEGRYTDAEVAKIGQMAVDAERASTLQRELFRAAKQQNRTINVQIGAISA